MKTQSTFLRLLDWMDRKLPDYLGAAIVLCLYGWLLAEIFR